MAKVKSFSTNYYENILSKATGPLSQAEETHLFSILQSPVFKGAAKERAKEKILLAHIQLINKIANDYSNKNISKEEIFSAAMEGFCEALNTFDTHRNARFATHLPYVLKGSITRFINANESIVHIPTNVIRKRRLKTKENQKLSAQGKDVSNDNSINFGYSVSADTPMADYKESPIAKFAGRKSLNADYSVCKKELIRFCQHSFGILSEREAYIVKSYLGFLGESMNFRDLEKELNLTHERIRQILRSALKKMKDEANALGIKAIDFAA